jgi:protease I
MKRALIIAADRFEDLELLYPLYRLEEQGWKVDVAAPSKKAITGQRGYEYKANYAFKEVQPEKYALLIIPGGKAPETVRLDKDALRITKHFFKKNLPVGAICHGAQVLISAGEVQGRKLTCYQGMRDDVIAAGADYRDCEAAEDHNLITSRRPSDLPHFMRGILELFNEPRLKRVVGGD